MLAFGRVLSDDLRFWIATGTFSSYEGETMGRALTIATAAAFALVLAGCGGETDEAATQTSPAQTETVTTTTAAKANRVPPTRRTLVGRWKRFGELLVAEFKPDGTFAIDGRGDLASPDVAGTYTLRGDTIRFTARSSLTCAAGDKWIWRASLQRLTTSEYLHAVYTKGGCNIATGERWILTRIG